MLYFDAIETESRIENNAYLSLFRRVIDAIKANSGIRSRWPE